MRRASVLCAILLLSCACAATAPKKKPQIAAVRVTFRGHLSAVRNCESRGLAPTLEAADAAGANLALAFAPPRGRGAPGDGDRKDEGMEPAWIPYGEDEILGTAGFRAFRCPAPFLETIVQAMKRPGKSRK